LEIGTVLTIQAHSPGEEWTAEPMAGNEMAPVEMPWSSSDEATVPVEPAPDSFPSEPPPLQAPPDAWTAFCQDKQKRSVIRRIHPLAVEFCGLDEDILYMAVQRKPLLFYSPECLVITEKRLFIFFKQFLKTIHHEFRWEELLNLQFKENLFTSHLTFKAGTGQAYGIYYLPKQQGRKAMQLASQFHETARERFKKTHVPSKAPLAAPAGVANPKRATVEADLEALKKLLEEQLISREDYEQKKHEILSRL
jgi:hypothetical protein